MLKTFVEYEIDDEGVIGCGDGAVAFSCDENEFSAAEELTEQANYVFQAAAMLKKHEWSGVRMGIVDSDVSCCPECRGVCPNDICRHNFSKESWGHSPDCKLDKLVNPLVPPTN